MWHARQTDLTLDDGRTLRAYDAGGGAAGTPDALTVVWHHGTPNIGAPPAPLFPAAERLGVRWVSYDRPGYGGSTPRPGRDMASTAQDVAAVADALGIERFAVMGHSSGGPHALASAALLPRRVLAAASIAGLAPYDATGLDGDWFDGMADAAAASLRAAVAGRAAKERHEASATYDPEIFTPADHAALAGEWSWFNEVVGPALACGSGPLIDDDLANVNPWGFDPATISAPVLVLHGAHDRLIPSSHGRWLARRCPAAELRLVPDAGHIAVMAEAASALEWLATRARDGGVTTA